MKVVLLTTDTTHHTYFAWKLNEVFPLHAVFLETKGIIPHFETFHPFEALRDAYERETLLKDFDGTINDVTDTRNFESMNSEKLPNFVTSLVFPQHISLRLSNNFVI